MIQISFCGAMAQLLVTSFCGKFHLAENKWRVRDSVRINAAHLRERNRRIDATAVS